MGRLAKLTDLFEEGAVAPLKASDGSQVVVWMNKLSPFEAEQAAHEGRIARARIMLAITEVGTAESDLFRVAAKSAPKDAIVNALVAAKDNERAVKVIRELHSEKEWKERLETLEWSSEQLTSKADDDPEVAVVRKVLDEYQAEMTVRTDFLRNEMRGELDALPDEKLRDMHMVAYSEQQGMAAFLREQSKSQIFYSMRVCEAVQDKDGRWQHTGTPLSPAACDHSQRWLDDRDEVDQLPESLLLQVKAAYDGLNMPSDVARFSAGPASSSESHGPSSKPEESKESGPEVTSDEPATISS
jgi:hypothetical protein